MPSPRVNPKAKIPPWALALAAVGAGVAFYMYKKNKEARELLAEGESSTSSTEEVPAELPVEPGFGGYGGYGGGGGFGGQETASEFGELAKSQSEFEKEFATSQSESDKAIGEEIASSNKSISEILTTSLASLKGTAVAEGSGGGAPSSPPPGGVVTAPVVVGQKPQPTTPAAPEPCTCGNGCPGHKDSSGRCTICMTKKPGPVNAGHPKGLYCSW